jgi:hypothetical protein
VVLSTTLARTVEAYSVLSGKESKERETNDRTVVYCRESTLYTYVHRVVGSFMGLAHLLNKLYGV